MAKEQERQEGAQFTPPSETVRVRMNRDPGVALAVARDWSRLGKLTSVSLWVVLAVVICAAVVAVTAINRGPDVEAAHVAELFFAFAGGVGGFALMGKLGQRMGAQNGGSGNGKT